MLQENKIKYHYPLIGIFFRKFFYVSYLPREAG